MGERTQAPSVVHGPTTVNAGGEGGGGGEGDGGGGGDGGDTHLTSTPPDIQLLLPQYCHEPPSSSGQYVLPLFVLISPPASPV